jgi:hypothetical protein
MDPEEHDWLDDYLPHESHVIFVVFVVVLVAVWGSLVQDFMAPPSAKHYGRNWND